MTDLEDAWATTKDKFGFHTVNGAFQIWTYDAKVWAKWGGVDGANASINPIRGSSSYWYGFTIEGGEAGEVFAAGAGIKTYLASLSGERGAAYVMTGDCRDMVLGINYTNYAANTAASSKAHGINMQITNRTAGNLGELLCATFTARSRGNTTGALVNMEGIYQSVKIDADGAMPSGRCYGMRVNWQVLQNVAIADSGGFVANQGSGYVYANSPRAAFRVSTDGTAKWEYGLDMYDDSTSYDPWQTAAIRLDKVSTEDLVITTGSYTDGADSGFAPGSLGLDPDGTVFYSDSAGLWQQIEKA